MGELVLSKENKHTEQLDKHLSRTAKYKRSKRRKKFVVLAVSTLVLLCLIVVLSAIYNSGWASSLFNDVIRGENIFTEKLLVNNEIDHSQNMHDVSVRSLPFEKQYQFEYELFLHTYEKRKENNVDESIATKLEDDEEQLLLDEAVDHRSQKNNKDTESNHFSNAQSSSNKEMNNDDSKRAIQRDEQSANTGEPNDRSNKRINDQNRLPNHVVKSNNGEIDIKHKVSRGDTLYKLSLFYYHSPNYQKDIARANNLNENNDLKVGQEIIIPSPLFWEHTVREGETLTSISRLYFNRSDFYDELAKLNGVLQPSTDVQAGMTLTVRHPDVDVKVSHQQFIFIDKEKRLLSVFLNHERVDTFPVGIGRLPDMTPSGTFLIQNKVEKPWYLPNDIPGGDPRNPLGNYWLGLNVPGTNGFLYGIHGTNDPSSIGKNVSAGCVRMYNEDVQWLFQTINTKTTVMIY